MLGKTLPPRPGWGPNAALGTLLILVGHTRLGTALSLSLFGSSLCLLLPALLRVLGAVAGARGEFAVPLSVPEAVSLGGHVTGGCALPQCCSCHRGAPALLCPVPWRAGPWMGIAAGAFSSDDYSWEKDAVF